MLKVHEKVCCILILWLSMTVYMMIIIGKTMWMNLGLNSQLDIKLTTSSSIAAIRPDPDFAIRLPNWSPILLQPRLTQYFRRHWIQFRQNQLRPISTNWSWSILLFQGTSNKRTILTPPVSNILKEVWHFEEMCPRLWNKQENYWNCQNCFGFQLRSI